MIILGAGIAGCLAGFRNPSYEIYEANENKPAPHKAVLRFRGDGVSGLTGIEFEKISVIKSIWYKGHDVYSTPSMQNMYSRKVTRQYSKRSISNIDPANRFLSPSNFHEKMLGHLKEKISYDHAITKISNEYIFFKDGATIDRVGKNIISTIPMKIMMSALDYTPGDSLRFKKEQIKTINAKIKKCNVHQTIYYPDIGFSPYRATIQKDSLIIEFIGNIENHEIKEVCDSFSVCVTDVHSMSHSSQEFGKIVEIDEMIRRDFINYATNKFGIYSLGRFATWRNILLDDVCDDLNVISKLEHFDEYNQKKAMIK